jgi:hypothetical protein
VAGPACWLCPEQHAVLFTCITQIDAWRVDLRTSSVDVDLTLQVMDNLVASLSRYTQLLNPAVAKPAIAFGESDKARLAAEAVFNIANQCVPACQTSTQLLSSVLVVVQ